MNEVTWWKSKGIDISLSEDDIILYEGPSYALTPQVLKLLRCQKNELMEELLIDKAAREDRRSFAQWMERMWAEVCRP